MELVSVPHSFLWPNNIPLSGEATSCLSIHPLMDLSAISSS